MKKVRKPKLIKPGQIVESKREIFFRLKRSNDNQIYDILCKYKVLN